MNAEQKLAAIEELLEERARINAELIAILEPEPTEVVEEETPVLITPKPGKQKQRKVRACSGCGKPGHSVTTCEKTKMSDQKIRDTFGSSDDDVSGQPLGEDDFNDLKYLQKIGDLSSKSFAEDRGVSLTEVNKAIRARNFREYERGEFLQNA
jgi:hypothetical protein